MIDLGLDEAPKKRTRYARDYHLPKEARDIIHATLTPRSNALVFAFLSACGTRIADSGASHSDESGDVSSESEDATESDSEQTESTGGTTWDSDNPVRCQGGIDDCPPGQKCQPYSLSPSGGFDFDTMCVPATGDKQVGEACVRERFGDDCDRDLWCLAGSISQEGPGECVQLCKDWEKPDCQADKGLPHDICISRDGFPASICQPLCHPLQSDCDEDDPDCFPECAEGEACYRTTLGYYGYLCGTPDLVEGDGTDGAGCNHDTACAPGLQCLDSGLLEACESEPWSWRTPNCDLTGDGSECAAETESCVTPFHPLDGLPHPAFDNVGVCATPAP